MKRPGRDDDSLDALISICPNSNEGKINNCMYAAAVMEGYEEEQCVDDEESWQIGGSQKKRRLRVDQVKALEKTFAVENKLEPERKVRLAVELGLQPRQVAVWFQNRRARWKTKQLERDYGLLRAAYDGLRLNFEKLQRDNEVLMIEIHELKSKMNEDDHDDSSNIKQSEKEDEAMSTDSEERRKLEIPITTPTPDKDSGYLNLNDDDGDKNGSTIISGHEPSGFKDGSSDSDNSSAVLNEEIIINKNHNSSSPRHRRFSEIAGDRKNHTSLNSFQFQESSETILGGKNGFSIVHHHHPFVKMEEHNFLGEESCSTFFSDDQPPSLHWYEWS